MGTDLELEGVTGRSSAKMTVPNGAIIHILLSEGGCGCETLVIRAPAFWWAVSGHRNQQHFTWDRGG